jgi:hypothetical protein
LEASLTLSATAETWATGAATAAGVVVSCAEVTTAKRKATAMSLIILI